MNQTNDSISDGRSGHKTPETESERIQAVEDAKALVDKGNMLAEAGRTEAALAACPEVVPAPLVPRVIGALTRALRDSDEHVRNDAAQALRRYARMTPALVPGVVATLTQELTRALGDADWDWNRQATMASHLGEYAEEVPAAMVPTVVAALIPAVENPGLRVGAGAWALGRYAQVVPEWMVPEVVAALTRALEEPDDDFVKTAAVALVEYSAVAPDDLVPGVVKALVKNTVSVAGGPCSEAHHKVHSALREYGARAPGSLFKALGRALKSRSARRRAAAAEALGDSALLVPATMVPEVVAALTRALEDLDEDVRDEAGRALALVHLHAAPAYHDDSPGAVQTQPASCPPELKGKRPQTLARMLKFAEMWRRWPADEAKARDLAAELFNTENEDVSPSSILQWKGELERLACVTLACVTATRDGLRFSPGAKDRLGLVIGKLRAALDWHRLGRPSR